MHKLKQWARYCVILPDGQRETITCYKMEEDEQSIKFYQIKAGTSYIVREGWLDGLFECVASYERKNIIGYTLVKPLLVVDE